MNDRHSKNDSSPEFEADSKQVAEDMNANKSEPVLNRLRQVIHRVRGMVRKGFESQEDGLSPLDDVKSAFKHLDLRFIVMAAILLIILVYILSGVYTVQPGEIGVVQRFGRVIATNVPAGLHYRLPWPIESETVVNIAQVRRESVGVSESEEHPLHLDGPRKLQVLSGDTNIIDFEVIVQYQINDPVAYLFNIDYPAYQLVRDSVRSAVAGLSGRSAVDDILTTARQQLQNDVRDKAQSVLDGYDSGIRIISTSFQKAYPPEVVADAFRDVSSAREDKDKMVNDAEGYRNSVVPQARGEAKSILSQAKSAAQAQKDKAAGAAQSFNAVLAQYRTNSKIFGEDVTKFRLYLEKMEKVLPKVNTYVVPPSEKIDLRILNGSRTSTFPPKLDR
ncbi:FtsH protease activity modulator HflK [Sphaerochaeta pleomorpha]|uniref:Protein HflK n=1 Tax=Sphaerochaeta pleomorpha (strain ATCC BAA-1885 / DSM 22778 / Grapes) TaxID=158190 RepID=G8QWI7_SPHPG|nr:FtsH protease activity modulator HflK [Sphaerochaeta pleomorpha]AEV30563.1 HflK protein [Sphaerochaeta pleomorpha str. Grapes]OHD33951.1 MAG: HflK protein [Spirochaetes bacterium GWC2_52_13]OHD68468.1 MAG: HflK protein [Spirochaetes bacterium GWF2_52_7]